MAVLKKVKASTLMETLVATILIIIIFMLASMILNNLFSNTIKANTKAIETHISELEYLQQHDQLQLPYADVFEDWNVVIDYYIENNETLIEFEAINPKTNKTISFTKNAN